MIWERGEGRGRVGYLKEEAAANYDKANICVSVYNYGNEGCAMICN